MFWEIFAYTYLRFLMAVHQSRNYRKRRNPSLTNFGKKLAQTNDILSKLRHYVPQKTCISAYFSLLYSFILYGSLAWQFTSKTNLNRVFILQKKCSRIVTFPFYKGQSNPLFKDLKLLKVRDVLESEIIKFFYKLSTNELPKSECSKFNLVHEIHTGNTCNNLLIYIPRITTSRYGNHSLRSDGVSLWNKFFKDFFPNHDLTSFLRLKSFLMKRFLQTYENEL